MAFEKTHLQHKGIFKWNKDMYEKGFNRQKQNLKMFPAQLWKELPLDFVRETSLPYLICMEKEETFW